MKTISRHCMVAAIFSAFALDSRAATITVLPSFLKEICDAFEKAFEQKYPDIQV